MSSCPHQRWPMLQSSDFRRQFFPLKRSTGLLVMDVWVFIFTFTFVFKPLVFASRCTLVFCGSGGLNCSCLLFVPVVPYHSHLQGDGGRTGLVPDLHVQRRPTYGYQVRSSGEKRMPGMLHVVHSTRHLMKNQKKQPRLGCLFRAGRVIHLS